MMDPEPGRFLSEDPSGLAGGDWNLYRYCRNDPVNRTDPSGLIGKDIEDVWIRQKRRKEAEAQAAAEAARAKAEAARAEAEQRADLALKRVVFARLYFAQQGDAENGGTLAYQETQEDGMGVWILETTLPGYPGPSHVYVRTDRVENPAYEEFLYDRKRAFIAKFGPPPRPFGDLHSLGNPRAEFASSLWVEAYRKYMDDMEQYAPPKMVDRPLYVGIWAADATNDTILQYHQLQKENEDIAWWDEFRDNIPIWGTSAKLEKAIHYWDSPDGKGVSYLAAAGQSFVEDIGYVMLAEEAVSGIGKLAQMGKAAGALEGATGTAALREEATVLGKEALAATEGQAAFAEQGAERLWYKRLDKYI